MIADGSHNTWLLFVVKIEVKSACFYKVIYYFWKRFPVTLFRKAYLGFHVATGDF
jgi:hypothetical protein